MAAGASPIRRQDDDQPKPGGPGGSVHITPLRELQLVEAYRQGGQAAREALSELLWAYQRRIYSICLRMTGNREDAGDLTQDVLVKLMEGLESFGGRSKLSTWVIRVTMNCCLSHIRRRKLRDHASLDQPLRGSGGSGADHGGYGAGRGHPAGPMRETREYRGREQSPAGSVEQGQARDTVVRALNGLDEEARAILVLRDLQDLDYQQLSDVLDVPVGTVKSRLFRARAAMRQAMESMGQ